MANRAYLIATDDPGTAGPVVAGDVHESNYNEDSEILAGASLIAPAFWLSLFVEENLAHHDVDEDRVPTLVSSTTDAKERLKARLSSLKKAFPDNSKQITHWKKLIDNVPFQNVKIDADEIWDLDPDSFELRLLSAVRWFSSHSDDDLQELQNISDTSCDAKKGKIRFAWQPKHNLHGYGWVRPVPWDDNAEEEPPKRLRRVKELSIKADTLEKHPNLQILADIAFFRTRANQLISNK